MHRWVGCKNSVNVTLDVRIVFSKQSVRILCVCLSLARSLSLSCSLSLSLVRSAYISECLSVCLLSFIFWFETLSVCLFVAVSHILLSGFSAPQDFFSESEVWEGQSGEMMYLCVCLYLCVHVCVRTLRRYTLFVV